MPTLETTLPTRRPPDKRRRTGKIVLAIVGSLLLHGLILLGVVWIVPHWPRGHAHVRSRPIELMVVPPKAPEPSGPANAQSTPPYIRTLDDQLADRPPDDPSFQSDKDTHAASERPADGNKPLPSLDGKELPSFDFEPRPYRLGKQAADAATSAPAAPEATPAPANTPGADRHARQQEAARQEPRPAQGRHPADARRHGRSHQPQIREHPLARAAGPDAHRDPQGRG